MIERELGESEIKIKFCLKIQLNAWGIIGFFIVNGLNIVNCLNYWILYHIFLMINSAMISKALFTSAQPKVKQNGFL